MALRVCWVKTLVGSGAGMGRWNATNAIDLKEIFLIAAAAAGSWEQLMPEDNGWKLKL